MQDLLMVHRAVQTEMKPSDISADTSDEKLNSIAQKLKGLTSSSEIALHHELTWCLVDLSNYINTMTYVAYANPFGGGPSPKVDNGSDDMVAKVKMEIRSFKGSLLNIRNFPSANVK